jgi:hypothetical protein
MVFYAYLKINKKYGYEVDQFFQELHGIINSRNVTTLLRDILIKDAMSSKSYPNKVKNIFLIKCWNAFINNKEIKIYKIYPDEKEIEIM